MRYLPALLAALSPSAVYAQQAASQAAVLVTEETPLHARILQPVDTEHARAGQALSFLVADDVKAAGVVAIPRGATLHGTVVEAHKAAAVSGRPELVLKLDSLELDGQTFPLYAYEFHMQGVKRGPVVTGTPQPAQPVVQANAFGTNGTGDAASDSRPVNGGGANKSVGGGLTFGSAPPLVVPAHAQMDFFLAAPLAVPPVKPEVAAVLARKLPPGPPKVYLQGER